MPMRFLLVLCMGSCLVGFPVQGGNLFSIYPENSFSLVQQWFQKGQVVHSDPVVMPSEVYLNMGRGSNGDLRRKKIIETVLRKTLESVNSATIFSLFTNVFGSEIGAAVEKIIGDRMPPYEEEVIRELVNEIDKEILKQPERLDQFPVLVLDSMDLVQQALFKAGKLNTGNLSGLAFPLADTRKDHQFKLRRGGCERPAVQQTQVLSEVPLFHKDSPIRGNVVPCFRENSEEISELLNRLSNLVAGKEYSAELDVVGSSEGKVRIESFEDLVRFFKDEGFTIEVYQARGFVNFFDYVYEVFPGRLHSLRLASWVFTRLGERSALIPGEHGEIAMLVHRNGKGWAQVRWFVGIPSAAVPVTAYWRPYDFLRHSWEGFFPEYIEVFEPESIEPVLDWWKAAAHAMVGFQAVRERFSVPFNAYGLYVCGDSLAMVVEKVHEIRRQRGDTPLGSVYSSGRGTAVFPLVRVRTFEHEGDMDDFFAKYAGMDSQRLSSIYIPDQELFYNPVSMKLRLQEAFPRQWIQSRRLLYFPEFRRDGWRVFHSK